MQQIICLCLRQFSRASASHAWYGWRPEHGWLKLRANGSRYLGTWMSNQGGLFQQKVLDSVCINTFSEIRNKGGRANLQRAAGTRDKQDEKPVPSSTLSSTTLHCGASRRLCNAVMSQYNRFWKDSSCGSPLAESRLIRSWFSNETLST